MARGKGKRDARRRARKNANQIAQAISEANRTGQETTVTLGTNHVEFSTVNAVPSTSGQATTSRDPGQLGVSVPRTAQPQSKPAATSGVTTSGGLASASRTNATEPVFLVPRPVATTTPRSMSSCPPGFAGTSKAMWANSNSLFKIPTSISPPRTPGLAGASRAIGANRNTHYNNLPPPILPILPTQPPDFTASGLGSTSTDHTSWFGYSSRVPQPPQRRRYLPTEFTTRETETRREGYRDLPVTFDVHPNPVPAPLATINLPITLLSNATGVLGTTTSSLTFLNSNVDLRSGPPTLGVPNFSETRKVGSLRVDVTVTNMDPPPGPTRNDAQPRPEQVAAPRAMNSNPSGVASDSRTTTAMSTPNQPPSASSDSPILALKFFDALKLRRTDTGKKQSGFGSVSTTGKMNSSATGVVNPSMPSGATGGRNTTATPGSQSNVSVGVPSGSKISSNVSPQSANASKKKTTAKHASECVVCVNMSKSNPGSSVPKESEKKKEKTAKEQLTARYSGLHTVPSPFRNNSARESITPSPLPVRPAPSTSSSSNTGGASQTPFMSREWYNIAFNETLRRERWNTNFPPLNTAHDVARDVGNHLLHSVPIANLYQQTASASSSTAADTDPTTSAEADSEHEYTTMPLLIESNGPEYRTLMEYLYLETLHQQQYGYRNPILHCRCILMCYFYHPVIYIAVIEYIRKTLMPEAELSFVQRAVDSMMDYIIPRGNMTVRMSMWMKRLTTDQAKAILRNQAISPTTNFDLEGWTPAQSNNPTVEIPFLKKLVIFLGLQTKKGIRAIDNSWKRLNEQVNPFGTVPNMLDRDPTPSTSRAAAQAPVCVKAKSGYWLGSILSVARQERNTKRLEWYLNYIAEEKAKLKSPQPQKDDYLQSNWSQAFTIRLTEEQYFEAETASSQASTTPRPGVEDFDAETASSQATTIPPAEEEDFDAETASSQASTIPRPGVEDLEAETASSQASTTPLGEDDDLEAETASSQASTTPLGEDDDLEAETASSQASTIPPGEEQDFEAETASSQASTNPPVEERELEAETASSQASAILTCEEDTFEDESNSSQPYTLPPSDEEDMDDESNSSQASTIPPVEERELEAETELVSNSCSDGDEVVVVAESPDENDMEVVEEQQVYEIEVMNESDYELVEEPFMEFEFIFEDEL